MVNGGSQACGVDIEDEAEEEPDVRVQCCMRSLFCLPVLV